LQSPANPVDFTGAIRRSAQTWNALNAPPYRTALVLSEDAASSNTIKTQPRPLSRLLGGNPLMVTRRLFADNDVTNSIMVEVTILVDTDPMVRWTTQNPAAQPALPAAYDVDSAFLHALGHIAGL